LSRHMWKFQSITSGLAARGALRSATSTKEVYV
jgi:hypothetical protein